MSELNSSNSNQSSPKVSLTANERTKLNAVVDSLLDGCELEAIKPSAIPKIELILHERHELAIEKEDYLVAQQLAEHLIKLQEIKENQSFNYSLSENTSQSPKSSFQFEETPEKEYVPTNVESPKKVNDNKPPNITIENAPNKKQPTPIQSPTEKHPKTPTSPKKTRIPIFTRKSISNNSDNTSVKSEQSSIDTESFLQTETEVMKIVNNIETRITASSSLNEVKLETNTKPKLQINIDSPVIFQIQLKEDSNPRRSSIDTAKIDLNDGSSVVDVHSDDIEQKIDAIPHTSNSLDATDNLDDVISVKKQSLRRKSIEENNLDNFDDLIDKPSINKDHISMISIPNDDLILCDLDEESVSIQSKPVKKEEKDLASRVEYLENEVTDLKALIQILQQEMQDRFYV
ncbi:hypothetical protein TVAG_155970 [Trichomonas vaginalis G3]|uniref:Uncharacterized protein n=1 Tax=Trichomonas vaginalis (strain ATCC PRA-98 / G3) TaxID=412133 RepID=A2FPC0_TRIV3|nr:hypothetical protein TVAGG3_0497830 [Trichomonas vaginalis G3]EAX93233.1 hypothetical protein TVAG_155970 [Trichomonas vaginalis G3]KAI5516849.1 hypothetical protein TVAGG3_0497830 [Trichomonas vaginalis G3]|eukprot:XP_001306163.1 hypothetical protein [Trichomonas vaginalis G3]